VVPLTIKCRRVVRCEEYFQQLIVSYFGRIEDYFDGFRVTRRSRTHLLVSWIFAFSTDISGPNRFHTVNFEEHRFGAPKASTCKRGGFQLLFHIISLFGGYGFCHIFVFRLARYHQRWQKDGHEPFHSNMFSSKLTTMYTAVFCVNVNLLTETCENLRVESFTLQKPF